MSSSEYLLAGIDPPNARRRPFDNPYRGNDLEQINFSSEMGKLCEQTVLDIWLGKISLCEEDFNYLITSRGQIVRAVGSKFKHRVAYVRDVDSTIADFSTERRPQFQEFLTIIDYVAGSNLGGIFNETISVKEGESVDRFRYLFQASMVLSGELLFPTFSVEPRIHSQRGHIALPVPGKMIPNISFSLNGDFAGQFDALIIPEECVVNEASFNLLEYLETRNPWGFLEIKTPFRPRRVTGPWNRTTPYGEDLKQLCHRLGHLVINWDEKHNDPLHKIRFDNPQYSHFPLPIIALVVYLRGIQPSGVINIDPSSDTFLQEWLRRVDYSCWPVDVLGDDGEEGENINEDEWEKGMNLMGEYSGETHRLCFPLFALVQTAKSQLLANSDGGAGLNRFPTTGLMINFDGQQIPVSEVLPKKTAAKKLAKKRPKINQEKLI